MNIAYFANPDSPHDCKWINHFKTKNKVIVITSENYSKSNFTAKELTIHSVVPAKYPLKNLVKRKKAVKEINELLIKEKIDLVHSMYAIPNAFWAHLASDQPHIITTRGSDVLVEYKSYNEKASLKQKAINIGLKQIFEASIKKAAAITCTSLRQKDVLSSITEPEKIHLIRTGVSLAPFNSFSDHKKRNPYPIVFHPRGTKPVYNVKLIIEAFKIFKNNQPSAKLVLASFPGNERDIEHAKGLIKKLDLEEHSTLLPQITHEEMVEQYNNASVVVMAPVSDGMPNTGIETMLAKKPLVVGPYPYDEDIYNNKTVWQVTSFDSNEIANLLHQAIISPDAKKKTEMAYETAKEKASLSNSLMQAEALYNKVLDNHG